MILITNLVTEKPLPKQTRIEKLSSRVNRLRTTNISIDNSTGGTAPVSVPALVPAPTLFQTPGHLCSQTLFQTPGHLSSPYPISNPCLASALCSC